MEVNGEKNVNIKSVVEIVINLVIGGLGMFEFCDENSSLCLLSILENNDSLEGVLWLGF